MGQLAITADDFGLHPAINVAVRNAHENGVLTHASIMSRGPAFRQAIEIARKMPTLSVGIHLSLPGNVSGSGLISLLGQSCHYTLNRRRIAEEWRAQINSLTDNGIRPSHLDSHQHIHLFPGLFPIVLGLALELGIPRVRLLRLKRDGADEYRPSAAILSLFQRAAISLWGGRSTTVATPLALGFNESGRLTAPRLLELIELGTNLNNGTTEIFCHPGGDNEALTQAFGWRYNWEQEMNALCAPSVVEKVRKIHVAASSC